MAIWGGAIPEGIGLAGNGLTLTGSTFSINTAITANLASVQTFAGAKTFASLIMAGVAQFKQGADTASANNLVLPKAGTGGNYYVITEDTQINLLDNTGWQDGVVVTLHLTPTVSVTVKSDQATAGANIKIILTDGADLVVLAAAPVNLVLRLCTVGGVQAWRQEVPVLINL